MSLYLPSYSETIYNLTVLGTLTVDGQVITSPATGPTGPQGPTGNTGPQGATPFPNNYMSLSNKKQEQSISL